MLQLNTCWKTYTTGAFGSGGAVAVCDVSFGVRPGEVVSLIGESGSGKSTIGKMILKLLRTTRGTITFEGTDITALRGRKLKGYYADVQGVFQDPFSSYNPIFKASRVSRCCVASTSPGSPPPRGTTSSRSRSRRRA